jgi:uncharacterized protein YjbI with pentapeptide repeats
MLAGAVIVDSNFQGASLQHAELATATLSGVRLSQAALSQAHLSRTVFARCEDLSQALGLDSLRYTSPSSIDLESLMLGMEDLPQDFLEGLGVGRREMDALRAVTGAAG